MVLDRGALVVQRFAPLGWHRRSESNVDIDRPQRREEAGHSNLAESWQRIGHRCPALGLSPYGRDMQSTLSVPVRAVHYSILECHGIVVRDCRQDSSAEKSASDFDYRKPEGWRSCQQDFAGRMPIDPDVLALMIEYRQLLAVYLAISSHARPELTNARLPNPRRSRHSCHSMLRQEARDSCQSRDV